MCGPQKLIEFPPSADLNGPITQQKLLFIPRRLHRKGKKPSILAQENIWQLHNVGGFPGDDTAKRSLPIKRGIKVSVPLRFPDA